MTNFLKEHLKNQRGVTLIEILVVVGILGFLFVIVGRGVNQRMKKAKIHQAKIIIGMVRSSLLEFELDCGYYPEDLSALVEAPADCESWGPKPYLESGKTPKDPWNNRLVYEYNAETNDYIIISQGADRRPGGTGFNKDITSQD